MNTLEAMSVFFYNLIFLSFWFCDCNNIFERFHSLFPFVHADHMSITSTLLCTGNTV